MYERLIVELAQPKIYSLTNHGRRVVVEDGGHVLSGEGVCRVGDEHARFPHGAVANDDAFDGAARRHHAEDARWVDSQ